MVISMLKIRRPLGRLIFNMGIAIPGKTVFLIETAPRVASKYFDVTPESFENILNLLLDSSEAILKWLPLFLNDSTN